MKSFFLVCCLLIGFLSNAQDLDSLLRKLPKMKEDTNKVNLYDEIAHIYYYLDKELCKKYTDSMLYLSNSLNYDSGKAIAHHSYAEYYYWKRDWEKMDNHAQKSQKLYRKKTGEDNLTIKYLYANYYREIGDLDRALKMYQQLIVGYRRLKDKVYEAKLLVSIAILFVQKERYSEAEEYFLKSAAIQKKLNNLNAEAVVYLNLGGVYGEQDNFEKALYYTTKAWEIQKELGNRLIMATCETNLAAFYNSVKDYKKGLEYINSASLVYEEQGDTYFLVRTHIQRAESYIGLQKYDDAISELNNAVKIIEEDPTLEGELIDVYYQYWKAYEVGGDYKNSLHYYKLYNELNEEIMNVEIQNNISQLKEQFEANQREEEIKLLQEQNNTKDALLKARTYLIFGLSLFVVFIIVGTIFIRKQNKLRQQKETAELEQRALRTQMNPHFIFNALNSIQRMYIEGNTEKANDFMADFGQLMRKVLENSAHSRISLQEEIDTLRLYMELEKLRCKDSFLYSIDIDETISAFEVQTPPLIIQPFVENAIWHGVLSLKDKKGEIIVSVHRKSDNELLITIRDNGIGFNDNATRKKHASKGIQITEQRIGSKVDIESKQGEGTIVSFKLKMT